ncbi:MAG: TolB family protein, partial [Solirubrobacteraceae bacterium]
MRDEPRAPAAHDAGVIEDARRRRRRQHAIGGAALAALAAAALIAVALPVHGAGRRALAFGAHGPSVDARAFGGEGDLAFISRRTLWVLDGYGGLRRIALPRGVPAAPAFSSDGRWLGFLSTAGNDSIAPWRSSSHLWIARADGSRPHEVGWLRDPTVIGWSPRSDELAVTDSESGGDTVWLLAPTGARRQLMSAAVVDGGTWSPDGSRIA